MRSFWKSVWAAGWTVPTFAPSVTAITSIGLDHQHILGTTLAEIAREKAGICKPGVPLVSGVASGSAADVIEARTVQQSADLFRLGRDFSYRYHPGPVWGSEVEYRGLTPPLPENTTLTLSMEGSHQAHNAAVALSIIGLLRDRGSEVDLASAIEGISHVQCLGRLERFELANEVTAIVDAAHNVDSMTALCQCLNDRCQDRKIAVVFGTSRDKDAQAMLEMLAPRAQHLVLTRFWGNPRFIPARELSELLPAIPPEVATVTVLEQPSEACAAALQAVSPGGILVVCGSFFLAAETRQWFAEKARG